MIGSKVLAEEYRKILVELRVPVSESKTVESSTTLEFAKRVIHMGVEITPFPLPAILQTYKEIPLLVATLAAELRRGMIPRGGVPGAIATLYGLLGYPRRFRRKVHQRASHCLLVTLALRKRLLATYPLTRICDELVVSLNGRYLSPEISLKMLGRACVTKIQREYTRDHPYGFHKPFKVSRSLGALGAELHKTLGGKGGVPLADRNEAFQQCPPMGVLNHLTSEYERIEESLGRKGGNIEDEWDLWSLLVHVAFPVSGKVFAGKTWNEIHRTADKMVSLIVEILSKEAVKISVHVEGPPLIDDKIPEGSGVKEWMDSYTAQVSPEPLVEDFEGHAVTQRPRKPKARRPRLKWEKGRRDRCPAKGGGSSPPTPPSH